MSEEDFIVYEWIETITLSTHTNFIVWITTSSFDLLKLLAHAQKKLVITELTVKGTGDNGRKVVLLHLLHRNKQIMGDVLFPQRLLSWMYVLHVFHMLTRCICVWISILLLTFCMNFLYLLEGGDTKLLEAATSALREALHKLAEVQSVLLGDVKDSDLQVRMIST